MKGPSRTGLLRYPVDIFSLIITLGVLGLSLLPLVKPLGLWSLLGVVALLVFFKPIVSLIQHNHVHYAIFNAKPLNIAFDLLLAITAGHVCSEWTLHHNIGHHGNPINSLDDTSSVRHPTTRAYFSKWQYIYTGTLKIYPDCCRMAWQFYRQGKPRYLWSLIYETLFWVGVHALLIWAYGLMALGFFLVANIINRALVWLGAYWHHLDVPAEDVYTSTNMYTGPIFNFISLNIGYHVAHHEQPTLHWSQLKARTAVILPRIPEPQILQKLP